MQNRNQQANTHIIPSSAFLAVVGAAGAGAAAAKKMIRG